MNLKACTIKETTSEQFLCVTHWTKPFTAIQWGGPNNFPILQMRKLRLQDLMWSGTKQMISSKAILLVMLPTTTSGLQTQGYFLIQMIGDNAEILKAPKPQSYILQLSCPFTKVSILQWNGWFFPIHLSHCHVNLVFLTVQNSPGGIIRSLALLFPFPKHPQLTV
jgi:hypothetical protein